MVGGLARGKLGGDEQSTLSFFCLRSRDCLHYEDFEGVARCLIQGFGKDVMCMRVRVSMLQPSFSLHRFAYVMFTS